MKGSSGFRLGATLVAVACPLAMTSPSSAAEERHVKLDVAPAEVVAAPKILVAPASAVQELVPSGLPGLDEFVTSTREVWQTLVQERVQKLVAKRKGGAQVVLVTPEDYRERLERALKSRGVDGFFDPDTGRFDEELRAAVMREVAEGLGGVLVTPRIVLEGTRVHQLFTGEGSPKAKWDGVTRKIETAGRGAARWLLGEGSGPIIRGQQVPVLSLRVEGWDGRRKLFLSDGGFELVAKLGGLLPRFEAADLDALFGPKNKSNQEEAASEAFEPLMK